MLSLCEMISVEMLSISVYDHANTSLFACKNSVIFAWTLGERCVPMLGVLFG